MSRIDTRDRQVTRRLRQKGWRVARLWEHDLKTKSTRLPALVRRLRRLLHPLNS